METERVLAAILEPALQGETDSAERDVLPRDAILLPQRDLQRLLARLELEARELRPVEEVHLIHARHRDEAEGRAELHARAGFFQRLAQRRLRGGLVVLHEPGGQRPVAVARLDRPAAEQELALELGDRADHQARILVVDLAALVAYPARERVARRHALDHGRGAISAEFHPGSSAPRWA